MILIISDVEDFCTELIQDYLLFENKTFIRINGHDKLYIESFELTSTAFQCRLLCIDSFGSHNIIDFDKITTVWYRRGHLNLNFKISTNTDNISIQVYLNNNLNTITEFLNAYLKKQNHINGFQDNYVNKITALHTAVDCGLKIPNSFIVSNLHNISCPELYITKDIVYPPMRIKNRAIGFLTQKLKNTEKEFSYSFIQDYIEKLFEVRTFYIKGHVFSMAIFSQSNPKTIIDFRNYDYENPNVCIRYTLPKNIHNKVKKLMKSLNINSGSIDFVMNKSNQLIFLEVNPVGQWHFVSVYCNYKLESVISNYLN